MNLEQQISTLAMLGLNLDEGITIDDVLFSFDREAYESKPFDLILFVLGIEVERAPWGRSMCRHVWNFDTECIASTGDYVSIVNRLCKIADATPRITAVSDFVDIDAGEAWLKYTVDGVERNWKIEVSDDWVDAMTVNYVMDDIERDGKHFFFKDNGQAMVLFYLDASTAAELNRLSGDSLKRVLVA